MKTPKDQLFRRLRNRLILIIVTVSTLVLVVAFAMIYLAAQDAGRRRPFPPNGVAKYSAPVSDLVHERIQSERAAAQQSLLTSLLVIGAGVEISVVFLSYVLAEAAIRPVKKAYEAQKIFIANASHEIKTPLAAISANFEAADFPASQWTENITHEIQTLEQLNRNLLSLAEAENLAGLRSAKVEKVNLEASIQEIVQVFAPRIAARGLKVQVSCEKMPRVELARADFMQIVIILLDNSVKYGMTEIRIELKPHHFTIKNDGTAISDQDLTRIFERFYQVDKSSAGAGLGLAIAKALAERRGWHLSATLEPSPKNLESSSKTQKTSPKPTFIVFRLDF